MYPTVLFARCPICNYSKYKYESWSEWGFGIVEQHGYCGRCGYIIDQAYSRPVEGFTPITRRGYVDSFCVRHKKDSRQRMRMKRRFHCDYTNCEYLKYL